MLEINTHEWHHVGDGDYTVIIHNSKVSTFIKSLFVVDLTNVFYGYSDLILRNFNFDHASQSDESELTAENRII